MASRKPRNFAAMREDRVMAMAEATFGRTFTSKSSAVEALSGLPVRRQHSLKKPPVGRSVSGHIATAGHVAKHASINWRRANAISNVVNVGVAARSGFDDARRAGKSVRDSAVHAAKDATLPAAMVAVPAIGMAAERAAARAGRSMATVAALHSVQLVARTMPFFMAGIGAAEGMSEDRNKLRGAVRGALRSFDPTAVVLARGAFERGFDKAFGGPDASGQKPVNLKAAALDAAVRVVMGKPSDKGPQRDAGTMMALGPQSSRSSAYLDDAAKGRSQVAASVRSRRDVVADDTTSGARSYRRTYTSGLKAGITETVTRHV